MLFRSLGVASATNTASNSEDSKPVTIRLTDSEVQLYDATAKAMGLTRQDFLAHLIRNNFKQALVDFLIGYTESSPSVSLSELLLSQTDNEEIKQNLLGCCDLFRRNLWKQMKRRSKNTLFKMTMLIMNLRHLAKASFLNQKKRGLSND